MDIKLLRAMIAAGASDEEITAVAMTAVQKRHEQEPEKEPEQEPEKEPEQEPMQNTNAADEFMKIINTRLDEIEQKIVNSNIMRSDIPTKNENPVDILAQIINPPKRKEE